MALGFNLIEAVIAQLEGNSAVAGLFGDTWVAEWSDAQNDAAGNVAKFFADLVDQVPAPYCLIEEVGESYQFMTRAGPPGMTQRNFIATGQMSFKIFASGRGESRHLGFAVAQALNDAPLNWPAENDTMEFRMGRSMFLPMTEPSGPNTAILFCRVFVFDYVYSASLEIFS